MRWLIGTLPLIGLAACSSTTTETFFCPNGPEIGVTYTETTATILFSNGRTEVLPRDPAREGFFAKPGIVWSETAFRTGRLTEGNSSYSCDQSSI